MDIIIEISVFRGNIHHPWILSAFHGNIHVLWILSAFRGYICISCILSTFCGNIHVMWILSAFCPFHLSYFTHLVKVTGASKWPQRHWKKFLYQLMATMQLTGSKGYVRDMVMHSENSTADFSLEQ